MVDAEAWEDAGDVVAQQRRSTKGNRVDDAETPGERSKDEAADSSGSEAETEPARSFHRKLSTNRAIKNAVRRRHGTIFFIS